MTHEERLAAGRRLARSVSDDDPSGWFDRLYAAAAAGEVDIPWERPGPHQLLEGWAREESVEGRGRTALVVGCGLGTDAEYLASLGFTTTAFDISPTALDTARRRFPESSVTYVVGDVLRPLPAWRQAFDLVFESLTVQSLPPTYHGDATRNVAGLVAPGGTLLVVASAREEDEQVDGPPWPLTRAEVDAFASHGLTVRRLEHLPLDAGPSHLYWRVELHRR